MYQKTVTVNKLLERLIKKNNKRYIKECRTEKDIKRRGNKLYLKWKGFNYSFK